MNLYTLKAIVAGYHKKVAADLTINSVDLFLVAANNALRNAQLLHNFELSRVTATLAIDGTNGGDLDDAVIVNTGNDVYTVDAGDAAGDYYHQGSYAGYPMFVVSGSTVYFLYYNPTEATYLVSTELTDDAPTDGWMPATDQTDPVGAYNFFGGASGSFNITLTDQTLWNGIKEVVAIRRSNTDGTTVPLAFTRPDIPIERDRTTRELSDYYDPRERYPSDADILNQGNNTSIIQRRRTLFVYPTPSSTTTDDLNVVLEAYAWLPNFTTVGSVNDTDQNFLLTYGSDWFQWCLIEELNYYFKTFVPRTEGNLLTPNELKQEAWRNLLLWDTYMIDANATRSR